MRLELFDETIRYTTGIYGVCYPKYTGLVSARLQAELTSVLGIVYNTFLDQASQEVVFRYIQDYLSLANYQSSQVNGTLVFTSNDPKFVKIKPITLIKVSEASSKEGSVDISTSHCGVFKTYSVPSSSLKFISDNLMAYFPEGVVLHGKNQTVIMGSFESKFDEFDWNSFVKSQILVTIKLQVCYDKDDYSEKKENGLAIFESKSIEFEGSKYNPFSFLSQRVVANDPRVIERVFDVLESFVLSLGKKIYTKSSEAIVIESAAFDTLSSIEDPWIVLTIETGIASNQSLFAVYTSLLSPIGKSITNNDSSLFEDVFFKGPWTNHLRFVHKSQYSSPNKLADYIQEKLNLARYGNSNFCTFFVKKTDLDKLTHFEYHQEVSSLLPRNLVLKQEDCSVYSNSDSSITWGLSGFNIEFGGGILQHQNFIQWLRSYPEVIHVTYNSGAYFFGVDPNTVNFEKFQEDLPAQLETLGYSSIEQKGKGLWSTISGQ
ncbi:MAG: hypothetical protein ACRCXZ_06580 [Patescibacteria group bacterium]